MEVFCKVAFLAWNARTPGTVGFRSGRPASAHAGQEWFGEVWGFLAFQIPGLGALAASGPALVAAVTLWVWWSLVHSPASPGSSARHGSGVLSNPAQASAPAARPSWFTAGECVGQTRAQVLARAGDNGSTQGTQAVDACPAPQCHLWPSVPLSSPHCWAHGGHSHQACFTTEQ